jgi:predicted dehydrogenase/threonine dehydrogenase-like Zn-dependent dehydrogenase
VKQVLVSGEGRIEVFDVPVPLHVPGGALVRTWTSLISSGTEGTAVATRPGWLGVLEKARRSPARVEQVWRMARSQGLATTWERVREKLADQAPLGYSAVGEVVEVDEAGSPFAVGQVVACVGAGVASHAEYLAVPKNLAVPVPAGVAPDQAAFAAIGCIGMQGIRRLEIQPGEWIGVIGLGLIGQVTARLARAMGYRVWATDPLPERVALAQAGGAAACALAEASRLHPALEMTEGRGLDGVIVCAATASDEPVNLAFDLCRQRGKVSVVGDVGLGLKREKMYHKELELRMSTSYGPGRYDPSYEFEGRDYPYGLVRWTERRNLAHFLALLADGNLDVGPLVTARYPIVAAAEAYARVRAAAPSDCGVLFEYPLRTDARRVRVLRPTVPPPAPAGGVGSVRLALIGVGEYVKAMHLPNLRRLSTLFTLAGVASRTGTAAAVVARRYGIPLVTTDYREVLKDPGIEAVLVSTRHATHAVIALAALQAGKHVYLEKPLSLTVDEGEAVCRAAEQSGRVLRVGFNRRFSPWLAPLRSVLRTPGRRVVVIRVNVGRLGDHWSNDPAEGGRLLGEGVHFFDLANWLLGIEPDRLYARFLGAASPANPDALVELGYPDGSAASVLYTTLGAPAMGKERIEVFGGGGSAFCDDYRGIGAFGGALPRQSMAKGDKGQLGALEEFAKAIRGQPSAEGASGWDGLLATRIALAAFQSAARGEPVPVSDG